MLKNTSLQKIRPSIENAPLWQFPEVDNIRNLKGLLKLNYGYEGVAVCDWACLHAFDNQDVTNTVMYKMKMSWED